VKEEKRILKKSKPEKLKVIELFAGVGGFRLGLEGWSGKSAGSNYRLPLRSRTEGGYEFVWSNQWEPSTKRQHANEVYDSRWPNAGHCGDDISSVKTKEIPDHDMLVGGFPCQDYSVATTLKNSKGLKGKKGVLWWEIERILSEKGKKAPRYLFLENVDRLTKSPAAQRGRDFAIILASLADLGYAVEWRVINAGEYGMPQRRRRIFIMGYRKGTPEYKRLKKLKDKSEWMQMGIVGETFPVAPFSLSAVQSDFLEGDLAELSTSFNTEKKKALSPFSNAGVMLDRVYWTAKTTPAYDDARTTLGDVLQPLKEVGKEFRVDKEDLEKWKYFKGSKRIPKVNRALGYEYIFSEGAMACPDPLDKPSRTVITGEGGKSPSRTKHIIKQGRTWRRLTPVELERLNMFPDNHTELNDVSDGRRAFFMGNALVVGVIERIGTSLLESMNEESVLAKKSAKKQVAS
jgi:DNA (cytosine-5)-methyltransferase 1